MDASAETLVQLVTVLLGGLLVLRIALSFPNWIRRGRRPESRSILVVGVGGGGGNAVDRMVAVGIPAVDFVAVNTDAQALRRSRASTRIRIGDAVTRGLGTGGDPIVGRRAAEEDAERIGRSVRGADLVFVTAGLGGGTGSGAAPVVAAKAKEAGALTIAVVTKPFEFEGSHRHEVAEDAAARLLSDVDALITVPNDRVGEAIDPDASALEAFRVVDDVLLQGVQGIVDLLTAPGLINLDFADVRAVVQDAGPALIGLGRGTGPDRAVDAAREAISSPLLEASISGARGILFHVSGPPDLRLTEVRRAADEIRATADPRANVIFGASFDESADGAVHITLIATGLDTRKSAAEHVRAPRLVARPPRSEAIPITPLPTPVATASRPHPEDNLELPTFLRNPRPTSAVPRRRDVRSVPPVPPVSAAPGKRSS